MEIENPLLVEENGLPRGNFTLPRCVVPGSSVGRTHKFVETIKAQSTTGVHCRLRLVPIDMISGAS